MAEPNLQGRDVVMTTLKVKKVWPQLFAHEIVAAQPMTNPSMKSLYLDWRYGISQVILSARANIEVSNA